MLLSLIIMQLSQKEEKINVENERIKNPTAGGYRQTQKQSK